MQDEQHLERAPEDRVRLVLRLRHPRDHRQEVLRVRQVVVGVDERQPSHVPIDERRNRWHLCEQADDSEVALLGVEDVLRLRIERREGRDGTAQHRHRVRVVAEPFEEFSDVLVHVCVVRDVVRPLLVLGLRRQLALAQQPRHLQESRVLGELLDRVAAVAEDSPVAIDEGDRALARRRVQESGVVAHQAELVLVGLDLAQIDPADRRVSFDARLEDRYLVRLSGARVLDLECVHCRPPRPRIRAFLLHLLHPQLSPWLWRSQEPHSAALASRPPTSRLPHEDTRRPSRAARGQIEQPFQSTPRRGSGSRLLPSNRRGTLPGLGKGTGGQPLLLLESRLQRSGDRRLTDGRHGRRSLFFPRVSSRPEGISGGEREELVMDKERIAKELAGIVGADGLVTDPGELRVYETDGLTVFKAMPDIVVLPRSTEQVAAVVKVCHREKIPFVARGAGTGLSGGALPIEAGILIGLNRMNRILEIDYENQRAIVEPGMVNVWLTNALAPRGYYSSPDPASQTACSMGGNVG